MKNVFFFAVGEGKFLRFMITYRDIKANPDMCEAILNMRSSTCLKKVKRMNGKLAALPFPPKAS